MPSDSVTLASLKSLDKATQESFDDVKSKLDSVKFTALEGQVAFIKELLKSPAETKKFMEDPKQYSVDHGVLLNPDVVKVITNQILFDAVLDDEFCATGGVHVTKDLVDLRGRLRPGGIRPIGPGGAPVNPAANAAAVAAGAAVAMAVVAVVTMVVTLVRAKRPQDLVSLQGLGSTGVLLPGNIRFVNRTKLAGIATTRGMGIGIR